MSISSISSNFNPALASRISSKPSIGIPSLDAKVNAGQTLTSAEYRQDIASRPGLINVLDSLSPSETALYDKLVADGNQSAAQGVAGIGLLRQGGFSVNGRPLSSSSIDTTTLNALSAQLQGAPEIKGQIDSLLTYLQGNPGTETSPPRLSTRA